MEALAAGADASAPRVYNLNRDADMFCDVTGTHILTSEEVMTPATLL
jgi:hypothetical protein